MRIIKENQIQQFIERLKKRSAVSIQEDPIQKTVRNIMIDVQKHGDRAVRKYTEKFDSVPIKGLALQKSEIESSARKIDKKVAKALKESATRIRKFHERQKERSWRFSEHGITLGQRISPLERVGVYVPGGKAAYPSSVLMNVIPAQVAGVQEIALCVPPTDGKVNPYVAFAVKLLGIREVYRIGGAQAVAALAFGTETIRKVDKIVGPGNIYVAVAKRMVFGEVGIDMVAGPSEILIIADESANPGFIAADLLSQAEHDEMASSVLITDSPVLAESVKKELALQMRSLKRKDIITKSLRQYGAIVITKDIENAVRVANQIAPEHLEVMSRSPEKLLPAIKNAGALFLGQWMPEPVGDYVAGPNHTLPTGGTARFSSPLGVYDFIKRTSLLNSTKAGLMKLAETVEAIADVEGLEAHGKTVKIRLR